MRWSRSVSLVGALAQQHVQRLDVEGGAAVDQHRDESLPRRHRERDALLMSRRQRPPVDDEALDPRDLGCRSRREATLVVGAMDVDDEALRFERLGEDGMGAAVLGTRRQRGEAAVARLRRSARPRSRGTPGAPVRRPSADAQRPGRGTRRARPCASPRRADCRRRPARGGPRHRRRPWDTRRAAGCSSSVRSRCRGDNARRRGTG